MKQDARRTANVFRKLTPANWMWVNFKIALGFAVPLAGLLTVPVVVSSGVLLPFMFSLLLGCLVAGAVLSIVGIVMQANLVQPLQLGYGLELGGIIITGTAPLLFTILYVYLGFKGEQTWLAAAFVWALTAVLAARAVDIYFDQLESRAKGSSE